MRRAALVVGMLLLLGVTTHARAAVPPRFAVVDKGERVVLITSEGVWVGHAPVFVPTRSGPEARFFHLASHYNGRTFFTCGGLSLPRTEIWAAAGYRRFTYERPTDQLAASPSPDGRFLAFSRQTQSCYGWEIVVVERRTGSETVFEDPFGIFCDPTVDPNYPGECIQHGTIHIRSISWSSDSKTLAFEITDGDTTGHSSEYRSHVWLMTVRGPSAGESYELRPSNPRAMWSTPAFRGRYGTLAIVEQCCTNPGDDRCCWGNPLESARVISIDPPTGEVIAPLLGIHPAGLSSLDFDGSGRHMVFTTHPSWHCEVVDNDESYEACESSSSRVFRWSGGDPVYLGRGTSAYW